MKDYAKELEIDDYVTFTGRISDEEMLNVLNTADVCVNPDIANKMNDISTMNKIMEYMALAKPIVQFDLAEGRFSAQEASLYARKNDEQDMADKIVELLDFPKLRKKMGGFGRNRVLNALEWKYEAPKLLKAYEELFKN
jgi:glycosyltransferase involved in cell wall biosynthesis